MVIKGTSALVQPSFIIIPQTTQKKSETFHPDLMQHSQNPSGHFLLGRSGTAQLLTKTEAMTLKGIPGVGNTASVYGPTLLLIVGRERSIDVGQH